MLIGSSGHPLPAESEYQALEGLGYLHLGANNSRMYKGRKGRAGRPYVPSASGALAGCKTLSGGSRFRSGVTCFNYWSSQGAIKNSQGESIPQKWGVKSGGAFKNAADPKLAEALFRFQWEEAAAQPLGITNCGTGGVPSDIYNPGNRGPGAKCPGADGILGTDSMCKIVQTILKNPSSRWAIFWNQNLNIGSGNMAYYGAKSACTFNCGQIAESRKASVGCPKTATHDEAKDIEVVSTGEDQGRVIGRRKRRRRKVAPIPPTPSPTPIPPAAKRRSQLDTVETAGIGGGALMLLLLGGGVAFWWYNQKKKR